MVCEFFFALALGVCNHPHEQNTQPNFYQNVDHVNGYVHHSWQASVSVVCLSEAIVHFSDHVHFHKADFLVLVI